MGSSNIFQWHPSARLFYGSREIKRPVSSLESSFRFIKTSPTFVALEKLGIVLGRGTGFCVCDTVPAISCTVSNGSFLTLSGGSSGLPKAIRRRQASWTASFDVNRDLFQITPDDRVAVLGRLSHSLALYGVLEGLHLGLDVHVLDTFLPSVQRAHLEAAQTTILYATPTQLRLLAKPHSTPLDHIRLVLCGGGPLEPTTANAIMSLCPNADFRVFYGAAETSFITLSDPTSPSGSVGRPYPGVKIDVRAPLGEIWVKSPYLFDGYASKGDHIEQDEQGYVSIGELGEMSADGTLTILGRKSRIVSIADQNVHLEQVENILLTCDEVAACAVLAVPDPKRGHRLIAVIEGKDRLPAVQDVKRHCREYLNPLFAPKAIHFMDRLPMLPSGKTDLVTLAKWLERQT